MIRIGRVLLWGDFPISSFYWVMAIENGHRRLARFETDPSRFGRWLVRTL